MFWSEKESCFYCDYDDHKPPALRSTEFSTRRDWARAYSALHADSHPLEMIGAFNANPQLARTLGHFSLAEAAELLSEFNTGNKR
jgi:hypothetical protein